MENTRLDSGCYLPGQTQTIQFAIDRPCPIDVTALGLNEVMPPNWTFVGVSPQTLTAEVSPADPRTIKFAFIDTSTFPITAQFTIMAPACETIDPAVIEKLPGFRKRLQWFVRNRPDLCGNLASMTERGVGERRMLSLVGPRRLRRILEKVLDESEFLAPHGVRALSRYHAEHPFVMDVDGHRHEVRYEPAESSTGLFGGNSNWRGPIWFPVNFLIIESLQKFHHYYGCDFQIEFPTGSGTYLTIDGVARELTSRLTRLFLRDDSGRRPVLGDCEKLQTDPHFRDYIPFHEFFHGDTGQGLGASHQTGWTGLVAKLLLPRRQETEFAGHHHGTHLNPTSSGLHEPR